MKQRVVIGLIVLVSTSFCGEKNDVVLWDGQSDDSFVVFQNNRETAESINGALQRWREDGMPSCFEYRGKKRIKVVVGECNSNLHENGCQSALLVALCWAGSCMGNLTPSGRSLQTKDKCITRRW